MSATVLAVHDNAQRHRRSSRSIHFYYNHRQGAPCPVQDARQRKAFPALVLTSPSRAEYSQTTFCGVQAALGLLVAVWLQDPTPSAFLSGAAAWLHALLRPIALILGCALLVAALHNATRPLLGRSVFVCMAAALKSGPCGLRELWVAFHKCLQSLFFRICVAVSDLWVT